MSFFQSENVKTTDFNGMRLKLASPEVIRGWSYGEVTKPETINYRTQKPEKSGLFAEEIFGPSKDWECYCGKYKKIRYKGIVCDKCGVEVTHSLVRRERMGHIELSSPVAHIWFLRSVPSRIGNVLDLSVMSLEKVVYFAAFIITHVDEDLKTQVIEQLRAEYKGKRKQIESEFEREVEHINTKGKEKSDKAVTEELDKAQGNKERKLKELEADFSEAEKELKGLAPLKIISENEYHEYALKFGHVFEAKIGAEAIDELLKRIDVPSTAKSLQEELGHASGAKYEHIIRRLKLLKSLSNQGIDPHWMILKAIPVIPPDLRPMVALDGGRFATSDLNDLYRRVINRNNRLKRLVELHAPEVITRNEKRMLQEAVDALIDNSARHAKTVLASTGKKRQLKSLADILKGKQGRFRQNLLGKRVDYSGRSVIVVGPRLKMHQCGLPKSMALELFRPFIIAQLIKREIVHNIRSANRFIEGDNPEVWDILEEIASNAVVLLNRAPTLHRLGIQGFQPVLIEGKSIQIHPLVCTAFNADFDGDQMAVHVPLTEEAQREAKEIMLSTKNLLKPATGTPVVSPTQDIVWGAYYMTTMLEPAEGKIKTFGTADEAVYAFNTGNLAARDKIKVRISPGEPVVETCVGRILVHRVMPEGLSFTNEKLGKKQLAEITHWSIERHGFEETAKFLDRLKEASYKYITRSGFSYGLGDLPDLEAKDALIEEADKKVQQIESQFKDGLLTKRERYTQIIKAWSDVQDKITQLSKNSLDPAGPVSAMIESGARGSVVQLRQVVGMKGMVTNPSGEIIELPIKSSFREGLDVLEYFISSHGTRKGLTDTALKTANAGHLTRRLVDVAQDVIITSLDCGDKDGMVLTHEECEEIGENLITRIQGRFTIKEIVNPKTKKVIVPKDTLITEDHVKTLKKLEEPLKEVHVRSVMSCKNHRGLCQRCYGYDLAYNQAAKLGSAVGVVAAQSIGEPGTQLTMRTFHTGGVASGADITQGLPRVEELFEARQPKHKAVMAESAGRITIANPEVHEIKTISGQRLVDPEKSGKIIKIVSDEVKEEVLVVTSKDKVKVKDGDKVEQGQLLIVRNDGTEINADHPGTIKLTKTRLTLIWQGEAEVEYPCPIGFKILVKEGDEVQSGDPLTEGHWDLQLLFKTKGHRAVMQYLLKEVLTIYATQGQKINSKHIETIIRQMFSRSYVRDAGDTDLLPGEIVEKPRALEENRRVEEAGGKPAVLEDLFMGITKVALTTESFLSSASFQETARVLISAAITGKVDHLEGLKENVIIGRLIPAGTGFGYHFKGDSGEASDYSEPQNEGEPPVEGEVVPQA